MVPHSTATGRLSLGTGAVLVFKGIMLEGVEHSVPLGFILSSGSKSPGANVTLGSPGSPGLVILEDVYFHVEVGKCVKNVFGWIVCVELVVNMSRNLTC